MSDASVLPFTSNMGNDPSNIYSKYEREVKDRAFLIGTQFDELGLASFVLSDAEWTAHPSNQIQIPDLDNPGQTIPGIRPRLQHIRPTEPINPTADQLDQYRFQLKEYKELLNLHNNFKLAVQSGLGDVASARIAHPQTGFIGITIISMLSTLKNIYGTLTIARVKELLRRLENRLPSKDGFHEHVSEHINVHQILETGRLGINEFQKCEHLENSLISHPGWQACAASYFNLFPDPLTHNFAAMAAYLQQREATATLQDAGYAAAVTAAPIQEQLSDTAITTAVAAAMNSYNARGGPAGRGQGRGGRGGRESTRSGGRTADRNRDKS